MLRVPALLAILLCPHIIVHGQLFPFGPGASDTLLPPIDDGNSDSIDLSMPIFGTVMSNLFVNTNGYLAIDSSFNDYSPEPFPIDLTTVAPMWNDNDPEEGGAVYYRVALPTDLAALSDAVDRADFTATTGFIATWWQVPAYNAPVEITNTYQVALASDGTKTFAIFNYEDINWSIRHEYYAQVGFDVGDGVNYFSHCLALTPGIIDIELGSNVCVLGRYIYGIKGINVVEPEPTCGDCLDVLMVAHKSSSVGGWRWENRMIPFMKMLAGCDSCTVGDARGQKQFALITHGFEANLEWNWRDDETSDLASLLQALENEKEFDHAISNIEDALRVARQYVLGGTGDRRRCKNICIVISDMPTFDTSDPCSAGDSLNQEICAFRNACSKVIIVGIRGSDSDLVAFTDLPDHRFALADFNELAAQFVPISNLMCD